MESLQQQLDTIEKYLLKEDSFNAEISKKSTYWQLDHVLQVIQKVTSSTASSDPKEYSPKRNPLKSFIMITGFIPRGKGKAPKQVIPQHDANQKELLELYNNTKEIAKQWDTIKKDQFFTHPSFGDMKSKAAQRFLRIHTHHHLKIVKDIAAANQ